MRWFLYDWLCAVWLVDLAIFAKARCYVETRVEKRACRDGASGTRVSGFLLFQLPTETKNFDRPIFL